MNALLVAVITLLPMSAALAQGNIVLNGDFEGRIGRWEGTYGVIDHAKFAFDGSMWEWSWT